MRVAIITNSTNTSSGSRAPIDLASNFSKFCEIILFAKGKKLNKQSFSSNKQSFSSNKSSLKDLKVIPYQNALDLYISLKKEDIDIISFHSTLTQMIAAKMTGTPLIKTYYGTQFNAYLERFLPNQKLSMHDFLINYLANKYLWLNQKIQLILANKIIAISKATRSELAKVFNTKSQLIYLGSNLKPSTHYHLPASPIGRPTTRFARRANYPLTILSVSRFTPYKGFHDLIDIVKNIREEGISVKLMIAGSPEKSNYLDYLLNIKDPQDQIILSPSDHALKKLYRQCDIVASCDRYPFFGLTLLEAAQSAKPVVALKYKAAEELIVHSKTGYLANSKREFEKYLKLLLLNEKLRLKMGKEAKNFSQNFNYSAITKTYHRIFQQSLKKNPAKNSLIESKYFLILLGILSSLISLEIAARLIISKNYAQTLPSFFQKSTSSILELQPNTAKILKSKKAGEFTTTVKINSQGVRNDYDYQIPKTPNTYRILMLGDSFTFGYGVENRQTFSKVLEDSLTKKFPKIRFEVINSGLASGFTWDEAYLYLNQEGLAFEPNLVILNVFLGNDVIDFEGHSWTQTDQFGQPKEIKSDKTYVSAEGLRTRPTLSAKNPKLFFAGIFNKLVCDPLVFCKILRPFVERNVSNFMAKIDPARDLPYFEFFKENLSPEVEDWWQKGQKTLVGLGNLAVYNNSQFLIVNIPVKEQVWDPNNILKNHRLNETRLENYLQQFKIPYCETKEKLEEQPSTTYFKYDSHLTTIGHRQVASSIEACLNNFEFLKKRNKLPRAEARGIFFLARFGSHPLFENRGFPAQNNGTMQDFESEFSNNLSSIIITKLLHDRTWH